MNNPFYIFPDNAIFFIGMIVMAIIALNPGLFVAAITFGRYRAADVWQFGLRIMQLFAGVSAVSLAVELAIAIYQRAL